MSDDRLITAIGRLERALSRIEAGRISASLNPEVNKESYAALKERHRTLRARTESAIERLDRLIGGPPPKGSNGSGGHS